MTVTLARLDPTGADREALIGFLVTHEWPFHVGARRTRAQVEKTLDEGAYRDEDNDSFWVVDAELGRVGIMRLEDLTDDAPLFNLRLAEEFRGRGFGLQALRAATDLVFTTMPDVDRFEGQTREDNVAMRRVFEQAGWVKEAHYRRGWPVTGGEPLASVAYGILRQDWAGDTVTPLVWDDLPRA